MKLAVLVSFSGQGGVERMLTNLINEFAQVLDNFDLIVIRTEGPHWQNPPKNVRLVRLAANHSLTAIPELVSYLKQEQPDALLVAKDRAGRAALWARKLAGTKTRIVVRLGTHLSTALQHRSRLNGWWRTRQIKRLYPLFDKIIAVSDGVAIDTQKVSGVDARHIVTVRNPVITRQLFQKSDPPHAWLGDKSVPTVMGMGRLSVQKDFVTLIHAFHELSRDTPARLIILGDGKLRQALETLCRQLGVDNLVHFAGFQQSPAAWLQHADVFVLSSRWEGSPNALTEALALGVPAVSTRCPSGPDELLAGGRYGPLVEVGDAAGLAQAIKDVLQNPPTKSFLQSAVTEYHAERSAQRYLDLLRETDISSCAE